MRSAAAIVTTMLLVAACGRDEPPRLPNPTATGAPIEIPDSPTATVDPEAESGFTIGTAAVSVTGAVTASETYPVLGLPALWVPPPGDFAMTWTGPGDRTLTLGGVSFTAQQPTSPEHVLSFTIRSADGELDFTSQAGECLVTISPALPDRMGGTFLCAAISGGTPDGATVTVTAQGTFTAE
jgi:hypothetical protein